MPVEAEKKWWKKRKESEQAWRVSIDPIKATGYNLDSKNPHEIDDAHRDPAVLLSEYQKLLSAVAETREKLKHELQSALER